MDSIRRYEIPLLAAFYIILLIQLIFHPTPEVLLALIIIYGILISSYVHQVKRILISMALIVSTSSIISVYVSVKNIDPNFWFNIVSKLNLGLISILVFIEANRLKASISEMSYSLTLALSLMILLSLFSPRLILGSFETSWLNYIIFMLSFHIYINERKHDRETLTNQLKVVLIIYSIPIIVGIKITLANTGL